MPIELLVQDVCRCGDGGVVVGVDLFTGELMDVLVAEAGKVGFVVVVDP